MKAFFVAAAMVVATVGVAAAETKVQVTALVGKATELYINGTHVKKGQSVTVGKSGKIEIRAVIVDPRRDQARKYIHGKSTGKQIEVVAASEYVLVYRTNDKTSDWRVAKETYEWKGPEAKSGAKLEQKVKSAGSIAKDDVIEIGVPAGDGEIVHGSVNAAIQWKGPADENVADALTYELKITH